MTKLQTRSTLTGPEIMSALAEQQAMAKAKKHCNQDQGIGSDPVAAALRHLHDAVASEALPDDFLKLLDEIDAKIAGKRASG